MSNKFTAHDNQATSMHKLFTNDWDSFVALYVSCSHVVALWIKLIYILHTNGCLYVHNL